MMIVHSKRFFFCNEPHHLRNPLDTIKSAAFRQCIQHLVVTLPTLRVVFLPNIATMQK